MSSNSACCTLPPVQANYTPKGEYKDVAGINSYLVGPADSKSTILFVYDVFGYSPQILQGADLLASQGFRVVMPDFLIGNYVDAQMFSGNPEDDKRKTAYFSNFPGAITSQIEPVAKVANELKSNGSKVGSVGACWGYKVIVESQDKSKFDAVAGIHPSFPAPEDVEKINVPAALLPSKDEDMNVMNKIFEGIEAKSKGKNVLKEFPTMPHGWMAARGDLESEEGKKNFSEGYEVLTKFFKANL